MGDESEWIKLPTDEKCVHKAWKARVAGYEEATKLFGTLDEKSPEFSKYLGLVKKFTTDSNAIAQEKALDAVIAFVENAQVAGKTASEVVSGVVAKCLNATRAKSKEKGMEIIMLYIEAEKQEIVQEELIKGLSNKQPKIVTGCVQALTIALRDFGNKIMPIKPLVKQIQILMEHRDKTVREETKTMVVEMYRWIGDALKPQLTSLKPVQITELETEFEKLPGGKPKQARFLKSQQDLKAKMEEQEAAGDGGGQEEEEEEEAAADVDPYDLMDPVEILSKLPKDFYEKIEAKKWQERKEVLEALHKLCENPKLAQGDYHDVVKSCKKVVAKDTNVMLVTIAAKCITGLANGLRKKFSSHAVGCVEVCLEKSKEKKVTVVAALRDALDASFAATTLDAISEIVVEMLGNKNPNVKSETAAFLGRCFTKCTIATLPKKLLKMFIAPLLKVINESSPEVRESGFVALGTAMKVVGEKPMTPFLADIDPLKLTKIKECCDKVEIAGKGGAKAKGAEGGAPPKAAAAAPKAKKAPGPSNATASSSAPAVDRPKTAPAKKGAAGAAKKRPGTAPAKGKKAAGAAKEEVSEAMLSDDAVEDKVAAILNAEAVKGLASSNWKERLAAMETFTQVIKGLSKSEIPCQACVRTIAKKPGIKDTNFQVLKLKVELIGTLAKNSSFSKTTADCCLSDLVDKVGDAKNGAAVQETLSCIAEAVSLDYVAKEVTTLAFAQKNPKNQSESLNWLAQAIKDFGLKVNIKPLIEVLKKALAATNPAVRTAAINVLTSLYLYMGASLRVLFENEKAALLQQIDAEFAKVAGEKPPAPTRGVKASTGGDGDGDDDEEDADEEEEGGGVNVADLVPRTDISEQIKPEIIAEMADKSWKIRGEALQKVITILNEAKFITPNIGQLPEALKARLGDSNKNLVGTTLGICQTIATAMGSNVKQHVRIIGPGMLGCLGDSKPHLRQKAVETLNSWVEQGGFNAFMDNEMISEALIAGNPFLKAELFGWLASKLPNAKKLPKEELILCIAPMYAALEDRSPDVRKKAQEAVLGFMIHLGYESMFKQAGKLKASSKESVIKILEQAKENLPAKPVKAKAPAKTEAPKAVANAWAEPDPEPEDVPPAAKKVVGGGGAKGKVVKAGAKKGAAPTKKKKDEDEDLSPFLTANQGKNQRFRDEKALKVLKWNFTQPRPEFIDQLKTQMEPTFNKTLMDQLFHQDFKKHIIAIEKLQTACDTLPEATVANLDLILKWHTLRFFDTNTSVLLKSLEYLQSLFSMLSAEDYHLTENEATSFIPYLINKVGDPKDQVRKNVRAIFKLICKVYPASKMFSNLITGLTSKNAKQRTECLEELGSLIESYGMNVCQPSAAQALKTIAGQISDRDNSVRSAALNTIVVAYQILGETVYKYIGNLSDKDMGMLDERIRRSTKNKQPPQAAVAKPVEEEKPKKAVAPPPVKSISEQRAALQRPRTMVKREFELDIEDDDEDTENMYEMPKLVEHDLEFYKTPIKLPERKCRPPSPSMKLRGGSVDAKSAIDLVISQIASNDITTSLQGLAQIDEVLKDKEKSELMVDHIDQFLITCSLQMRMTYSKHMGDSEISKESVIKLYRTLIGSLMALFQCGSLVRTATRDVLKDLLHNILTIMLDQRLTEYEEGPQVIRSINVMVVKMVEKSDPTNILSALIKLLHDTVASETSSSTFIDIVMKCLWRTAKMLPKTINDLNLDKILLDMHNFLKAFPSATWKTRPSDLPLRTIRTLLHSMAKLKGNKIMSHLELIDDLQSSELETYLQKVLRNGLDSNTVANSNSKNEQMNGTDPRSAKKEGSKSSRRLSKCNQEMMAEIFKKIGSKENTREGLNDLYDFKLKYPDADLDPFIKKCSQFFQNYIDRGLRNIEMEREGKNKQPGAAGTLSASSSNGSLGQNSTEGVESNPSVYLERLKVLRARCGLDNNPTERVVQPTSSTEINTQTYTKNSPNVQKIHTEEDKEGSQSSLSSNSSGGFPQVGSTVPKSASYSAEMGDTARESAANFAELKKRLEKIKNSSKT